MPGPHRIHHVVGGGTVNHVRSHFAIAAMAYGATARSIAAALTARGLAVSLHLTKMACAGMSDLETNDDLEALIDRIVGDPASHMLFFNAAVADFEGQVGDVPSGKYADRLRSRESHGLTMALTPARKVVARVKAARPDILLVVFKTTIHAERAEQQARAAELLAESGADLVLANDTGTRLNLIVAADGQTLLATLDRDQALARLVALACERAGATAPGAAP